MTGLSKIVILLYSILFFITISADFTITALSQGITSDGKDNYASSTAKSNESEDITVIDAVGDIDCSSRLHDRIINDKPTLFIALGDLCYKRDLTNFTLTYSDFKNTNKLECVIGNHDSEENGNLRILNQALEYCGDHWYRKVANNSTLLIGLNTNGNTTLQANWGQALITNSSFMKGIVNVIILAHKPAHTPPGSDHMPENPTVKMFSAIMNSAPNNVRVFEVAAHNHLMAESNNGQWFISGAGSKRLYNFSPDSTWPFVNNNVQGYLQFKINNTDGMILGTHFYGIDGRLIH
ncbi:MAG: metallophosphoesterase [Nitrososphaeraceae archaeon]|nr:metallophosphoesterase [Nitrososphaeraceae archaeon]MDW0151491.1 metallophosphoesterase [Nitrososphaeraceae archaeon]